MIHRNFNSNYALITEKISLYCGISMEFWNIERHDYCNNVMFTFMSNFITRIVLFLILIFVKYRV